MNINSKFNSVLKSHDPRNKKSHSILRFFSEDLEQDDKLIFIKSIFEQGSWILSTEISISGSQELKSFTKEIFYKVFNKWVNERINHSSSIETNRKVKFIPQVYTLEFREALISLKNLDFPDEIMAVFHELLEKCQISYSKKFLEDSCWIIFEEFNLEEIEKFFSYFYAIYIKNRPIYLTNFFYIFLSNLAYTPEIFNINESFLIKFRSLSQSLKRSDYKLDYNILISIFLLEYIENKELNISKTEYKNEVDILLNTLEKGDFNNLDLFKFLKRFSYNFEKFDFNLNIQNIFEKLENNITIITQTTDDTIKKNVLHHYLLNSEQYFELFIYCLENISIEHVSRYLLKFIRIIDRLRESFSTLFWFEEYLNFEIIKGKVIKEIPHGYKLEIEQDYFNSKINKKLSETSISEEFFLKNAFGFVKSEALKEFNRLIKFQDQNEDFENKIENYNQGKIEDFLISSVNYSIKNQWGILTLIPYSRKVHSKITNFQLKAFFPFVELFLVGKAYQLLSLPAPFKKTTNILSKPFSYDYHNEYVINFLESDFWNLLKEIRPFLYYSIYEKAMMEEEIFNEILDIYDKGGIVVGKIISLSSGGMIVNIKGIHAFLPGSQIDYKPVIDHSQYLNQILDFKILKITKETKNVVLSHRALTEAEYEIRKETFINNLKKGQILKGTVKNITNYGVFMDLGCVDGLIHIADLSWSKINHPQDLFKIDQKLEVIVLDFYLDGSKITLGLKQLDTNFIVRINKIIPGDLVEGEISRITNYGIFFKINIEFNVLIHISEIWYTKIPFKYGLAEDILNAFYKIGDKISAVILTNDPESYQISARLKSIKQGRYEFYNLKKRQIIRGRVIFTSHTGGVVALNNGLLACIDISEIDWKPIPKKTQQQLEYVQYNLENKEFNFIVLNCNKKNKIINLGLKQIKRKYWSKLSKDILHKKYEGSIIRIINPHYIIELSNGLEGLLFKPNIRNLKIGSAVHVSVIEVNQKNQNLTLRLSEEPNRGCQVF